MLNGKKDLDWCVNEILFILNEITACGRYDSETPGEDIHVDVEVVHLQHEGLKILESHSGGPQVETGTMQGTPVSVGSRR